VTWTSDKPTQSGWYFYRERGKNRDKPMSAWIYTLGESLYLSMFVPHRYIPRQENGQLNDFPGEWWGPVEVPE
jgi:hypothetical protein